MERMQLLIPRTKQIWSDHREGVVEFALGVVAPDDFNHPQRIAKNGIGRHTHDRAIAIVTFVYHRGQIPFQFVVEPPENSTKTSGRRTVELNIVNREHIEAVIVQNQRAKVLCSFLASDSPKIARPSQDTKRRSGLGRPLQNLHSRDGPDVFIRHDSHGTKALQWPNGAKVKHVQYSTSEKPNTDSSDPSTTRENGGKGPAVSCL
ncbi:hypothetical protein R6Q59_009964 [Mikania micrantha]